MGRRVCPAVGWHAQARRSCASVRLDAATGLGDLPGCAETGCEALKGERAGQWQHPHQRSVACVLQVARWGAGSVGCRNRGLPREDRAMTREPIHPGRASCRGAAGDRHQRPGAGARAERPGDPHHRDSPRPARRQRRHRAQARPLFPGQPGLLDEPAEALRARPGAARDRRRACRHRASRAAMGRTPGASRRSEPVPRQSGMDLEKTLTTSTPTMISAIPNRAARSSVCRKRT